MTAITDYNSSQLTTIRHTVARDTNNQEFDLFMNAAKSYGLDPFRGQITAIVFSKDTPKKRRMTIIVGRDGLRSIAQRCGDYRPASGPAKFVYVDELKCPLNPLGIESVGVELFKQDGTGTWHTVYGEAYWDEFAPIKDEWGENEQGKWKPTGKKALDTSGQWGKMPRVMLQKCAEAQALRAGWPDVFAGIYASEEMDQAQAQEMRDITPSEIVQEQETHDRQNLLGNKAILFSMDVSGTLERIPVGSIADRVADFIGKNDAETVSQWAVKNKEAMRDFWAESPTDALEIKPLLERKQSEFVKSIQSTEAS